MTQARVGVRWGSRASGGRRRGANFRRGRRGFLEHKPQVRRPPRHSPLNSRSSAWSASPQVRRPRENDASGRRRQAPPSARMARRNGRRHAHSLARRKHRAPRENARQSASGARVSLAAAAVRVETDDPLVRRGRSADGAREVQGPQTAEVATSSGGGIARIGSKGGVAVQCSRGGKAADAHVGVRGRAAGVDDNQRKTLRAAPRS
ncbi:hypothetical protein PsYK624_059460 [Phanerochaete sordida]|uniref:Uncharacterized protein n=1 Tax=Phanerochaete sordida TaxID=48140 RepID=A0A9P3G859_9APHY|nr:hypothetical protein PsYK624_059460 [Phanerochaete sordida]